MWYDAPSIIFLPNYTRPARKKQACYLYDLKNAKIIASKMGISLVLAGIAISMRVVCRGNRHATGTVLNKASQGTHTVAISEDRFRS